MTEHIFSEANLLKQLETAPYRLGFYTVKFYTSGGKLAAGMTESLSDFYLYPSGGTLRDSSFNIVFYSTRFDVYKGFQPPVTQAEKADRNE